MYIPTTEILAAESYHLPKVLASLLLHNQTARSCWNDQKKLGSESNQALAPICCSLRRSMAKARIENTGHVLADFGVLVRESQFKRPTGQRNRVCQVGSDPSQGKQVQPDFGLVG